MMVRTINAKGQITLGKKYAGRVVTLEPTGPDSWKVVVGIVIPENEKWLHKPHVRARLERALAWSASHPAADTDWDALEARMQNVNARKRAKSGTLPAPES